MPLDKKGRAASLFCCLLSLSACASDSTVRGRFYWGHEVRSFQPPLYIEAVGEIDTESKREGFAQSYDGLFHLRGVSRVSDAVPEECS